jgi:hypothetical protein
MVISPERVKVAMMPALIRTKLANAHRVAAIHIRPSANATSRNIDVMVG